MNALSQLKLNTIDTLFNDFIMFYKQRNAPLIKNKLSQLMKGELKIQGLENYNAKQWDSKKQENDSQFTDYVNFIQSYIDWIYIKDIKQENQKKCIEFFINQTTQMLLGYFENISESDKWFLPVIKFHLNSIPKYYKGELENNSSIIVMKIRSFLQLARKGQLRRSAYQVILNLYISIYFLCHNYALCSQTLNSESQLEKTLPIDQSPKSEKIIFMYYAGRMKLYENKFSLSQEYFSKSLKLCKKGDVRHQRSILKFLLPVRMFQGFYPSTQLLKEYSLYEYVDVVQAIQVGNVYQLDQACKQYRKVWIKRGLFLIFDKLRLICLRNLFKRIWMLYRQQKGNEDCNQIPLDVFKQGYEFSRKSKCDSREVACIFGNLCMLKLVKGYIFNTNTVVLKKGEDPFPNIKSIVDKMQPDMFS